MAKNKTIERVLRLLITLVGVGVGALVAALVLPVLRRTYPSFFLEPYGVATLYLVLCFLGGLLLFLPSRRIQQQLLQLSAAVERRWSSMPTQQIFLSGIGLISGLIVSHLARILSTPFSASTSRRSCGTDSRLARSLS